MIQIIINTYKGKKIRIISALYQTLTTTKHSTKYIKEKWESEFNTKILDDDWQDVENTSDNQQFADMERHLEKSGPLFYHAQGQEQV